MRLITAPDKTGSGSGNRMTVAQIFRDADVKLPDPPAAYALICRELSGGSSSTDSRIGDSLVSATRGIPMSASQDIVLRGDMSAVTLDLNLLFIWLAKNEIVAISALVR
jgi:hypothetical protein